MIEQTPTTDGVRVTCKPLASAGTMFRSDISHTQPGQTKFEIVSLSESLSQSDFMTLCNEVSMFRKVCATEIEKAKKGKKAKKR